MQHCQMRKKIWKNSHASLSGITVEAGHNKKHDVKEQIQTKRRKKMCEKKYTRGGMDHRYLIE